MRLTRTIYDAIFDHIRPLAPYEGCALLLGRDDEAQVCWPCRNVAPAPDRNFLIDSTDQYDALMFLLGHDLELIAIVHSHTKAAAYPSTTDVHLAANWEDVTHVIVTIEPEVMRAYRIKDAVVTEESVTITADTNTDNLFYEPNRGR